MSSWLAEKNGFTKVGILAYGVSAESKLCATGTRDSYARYTNGKVKAAFFEDSLPFAADLTADVANMPTSPICRRRQYEGRGRPVRH